MKMCVYIVFQRRKKALKNNENCNFSNARYSFTGIGIFKICKLPKTKKSSSFKKFKENLTILYEP